MKKKYYSSIKVDKEISCKNLAEYANLINESQLDENNKFPVGAKKITRIHREIYETLLFLLIKKVINPTNTANKICKPEEISIYNIDKPLQLLIRPNELRDVNKKGIKMDATLQTLKNRMQRLEEHNVLQREWKRGATADKITQKNGKYLITFNPDLLCLKDYENDEIIKNIDFEKIKESITYKNKNENLEGYTNQLTNKNNKIIHSANVDNRSSLPLTISSLKNEHLEETNKEMQMGEIATEKMETPVNSSNFGEQPCSKTAVASQRIKNIELQNTKKTAANRFYEKFIIAFWAKMLHFYSLKSAPAETLHYVSQSIETLVNDNTYFGACQTEKAIEYQEYKLNQALKSTKAWHDSKVKKNENFTFRYLYPNAFLKANAGSNMSFKNSVIHAEKLLTKRGKIQMEFEKNLQKERDKQQKDRFNYITSQIIAYIMLNPKLETPKITAQAAEYLREIHPELVMKLYTDIKNTGLVKQILQNHKEFDLKLINDCFIPQAQIENDIKELLPKMQSLLQKEKLSIDNRILSKFNIRGAVKMPIPKMYDKDTLKLMKYLLR